MFTIGHDFEVKFKLLTQLSFQCICFGTPYLMYKLNRMICQHYCIENYKHNVIIIQVGVFRTIVSTHS